MAGKKTDSKTAAKTAAKTGGRINKSRTIINYYTSHPGAKPREIVNALKRRGIKLNAQYVSTILFNYRKKLQQSGFVSANPQRSAPVATHLNLKGVSAREIMLAKQLVKHSGSIKAARKALDLYSDIIA